VIGARDRAAGERARSTSAGDGVVPGWALAAGLVPLGALVLEYAGSLFGQGVTTSYPGWLITGAWPTWARVVWWLIAAAGALIVTRGLARANGRRGWVVSIVVTAPFVGFAAGVAAGTEWSAWH
jgi:hypothetical protein